MPRSLWSRRSSSSEKLSIRTQTRAPGASVSAYFAQGAAFCSLRTSTIHRLRQLRGRYSSSDHGPLLRDRMMEVLPSSWTKDARSHLDFIHNWENELSKSIEDREDMQSLTQGFQDFHSVFLTGARNNSVHAGVECAGLANLRLCESWV